MSLYSAQINVMSIDTLTSQDNHKLEEQPFSPYMIEKNDKDLHLKNQRNQYYNNDNIWSQETALFRNKFDNNSKMTELPYPTRSPSVQASSPSSSFFSGFSSDHNSNSSHLISPISPRSTHSFNHNNQQKQNQCWLDSICIDNSNSEKRKITSKKGGEDIPDEEHMNYKDIKALELDYPRYTYLQKKQNKNDALQTRRARNKLASAKYRAKKQALSQAMQDQIMQLATQVVSLRDELYYSKKKEAEILARYNHLLSLYQNQKMKKIKKSNLVDDSIKMPF